MRTQVLALAALVAGLVGAPARADDLFRTQVGSADFSGADLGIDVGAVMGSSGSINTSGMAGGGHAGYNLQNGPIVGGVSANMLFGNVSGGASSQSYTFNSLGSLRGQAGYVTGPVLLFGSLGWAFSSANYTNLSASNSQTLTGYVFGVGAEFAVTRNVSLRAELSHYDFGNAVYYMPAGAATVSTSQNVISLGVATHF